MPRLFIYLLICISIACSNGHTTLVISNKEGIKKKIETTNYGTGGGLAGTAPNVTKRSITKYDSNNRIIYFSEKEIHRDGCFFSMPVWQISATDSAGMHKEFTIERDLAIIKITDSEGKVVQYTRYPYFNFPNPDWFDSDETNDL